MIITSIKSTREEEREIEQSGKGEERGGVKPYNPMTREPSFFYIFFRHRGASVILSSDTTFIARNF